MAITAETRNDIIELVVTAYDAAPGTTLLTELVAIVDGGGTLADVAAALTTSDRWNELYPSFQTAEEFAAEWLGNLVPEADADALAEGVSIAVGLINGGASFADLILEAQGFLSTVDETDASFGTSAANFNNKVEVATNHTVTNELDGTDSELQNVLAGVTSDDSTVDDANDNNNQGADGDTFTLTDEIDTVIGTTGNDTVNGIVSDATGETTFNIADDIDLGAGDGDVLNLSVINDGDGGIDVAGQSASGVERVNIRSIDGSATGTTASIALSGISTPTSVWVQNSSVIGTADDTVTITGVASGVTLGLANNDSDLDINFTNAGTATSGDSLDLALGGGSIGNVTLNDSTSGSDGFVTVNIDSSGSSNTIAGNLTAGSDFDNIIITGDQALTILTGVPAAVDTIDASAATGAVTINATAQTDLVATGGSAADTLLLTVNTSILTGMDVSGFETVAFAATGNVEVDATLITGAAYVASSFSGANGAVLTLSDVAANPTFTYSGTGLSTSDVTGNGVTFELLDDSGSSDSVNFVFTNLGVSTSGDPSVGTLTAAGVETVNITAADFDNIDINGMSFSAATRLNITATTDQLDTGAITAANLETLDAADSTADLDLGSTGIGAIDEEVNITLGSGDDTIVTAALNAGNHTVETGAGDDTVTVSALGGGTTATLDLDTGAGADSITLPTIAADANTWNIDGGDGTDTVTISAAVNIDSWDNIEEVVLTAPNVSTFIVAPGYADTVEYTDVASGVFDHTFTLSSAGTLSLANFTFLGATSGSDLITITGSTGTDVLTGSSLNDTINGGASADTITGGAGADAIDAGAGIDTVVVAAGDTVLTIGGTGNAGTIAGFDTLANFAASDGTALSETLNTAGTASVVADTAGTDGTDSTLTISGAAVKSHAITNGIITFDDADTFAGALTLGSAATVAAVVEYLQAQDFGDAGATVAFVGNGNTYVFTQGTDAGTDASDVLVEITGVTTIDALITTNVAGANDLFVS